MASNFNHSTPLTAGTTRTLAYGPVATGTTAIIFSGTLTNVDSTTQSQHWITLESYNGSTYSKHLFQIPLPFGSTSKVPKVVLMSGESLYVTSDAASVVDCRFEVLTRT